MRQSTSSNVVSTNAVARYDQSSLITVHSVLENSEDDGTNPSYVVEEIPGGNSYYHWLQIFEDGTENMSTVDAAWLTKQGFTKT